MNRKPDNAVSFRRAWALNLRAWKMWLHTSPGYFAANLLSPAGRALAPYLTIWLSARIIAELSGGRDARRLAFWAMLTVGATALLALGNGVLKRWSDRERSALSSQRFRPLADKMAALDYAQIDRQEIHDLYSQIHQNDNWSGYGLWQTLVFFPNFCKAVVQVAGGIGFTLTLFFTDVPAGGPLGLLNSPLCMVGVLAMMVAAVLVSSACSGRANLILTRQFRTFTAGNRFFSFYGMAPMDRRRAADMRIYCQQENLCEPMMRANRFFARGSPLAKLAQGRVGVLMGLAQSASAVLTCAVYLFVCLKAWAGAFGVGAVTQYVGAATQLFGGISLLLETLGQIRADGPFLEQTFTFLDLPNPMYQGSLTTEKRSDRNYQVEFRDVSFRYPGTDRWAVRHLNIRFRIGRRLAVVGPNGSGKTTFIKLLCRLYDPTEGEILLNGIDIRKYRYEEYLALFSVVFQDFRLLALPLGENVAGAAAYDRDRAARCLADAGFGDRLDGLDRGLDTILYRDLDKTGVEISGGEAQKIAIARALYKDAPFLVLDEPTAALDPIAEAEIYTRFDAIAGDKTAVYISHRLSSCKFCDTIVVFEDGAIVQTGTHADLLADTAGLYRRLWQAQAQYYTES
ncbi:MAG: ABC transporter ATP-binding protein [Gemmiger sp.]|uniref:ABC transporter ATP-binding protein n=1 Tax=Gemmiger sp. TaxID=2049027 RepID=UPI002E770E79|nr:ABC transporter ATP-binding protein [Gemmiger sp.]MEE0799924.1 ABC transporter ATP-binding protein [Gemmiger sp.]